MRLQKKACIFGLFILVSSLGFANVSGEKVVLVTGFEPFGAFATNPSQLIAETLNGTSLNDAELIGIVLPVDFNKSLERAIEAVKRYHPNLVISVGLAARSKVVRVEKIAVNLKRFQNDDGTWSFPQRIDKHGPFFRVTTLHTSDITRKIQDAQIPVRQSFFAGFYICNALYYGLIGYVNDQNINTTICFLHVPLLDSQDPQGMPLETMVDAVKIAIQVSLGEIF